MFNAAFGEVITLDKIGKVFAAFQRIIVIEDTTFDQFLAGDYDAMTDEEIFSMEVFSNKAQYITCHNGPHLTDNNFYNVGSSSNDICLMEHTGHESDDGAFRTSELYGSAHHPPYMHNGSIKDFRTSGLVL